MSTRQERDKTVKRYEEAFGAAQGIYLTDFSGIRVDKITRFRAVLRDKGIKYIVVKNTLARRALETCNGHKKDLVPFVKGHIGAVVTSADGALPSKLIRDFQKENADKLTVRAAYVDGAVFGGAEVGRLADLPSREVLLAQLLGLLKAPPANLAGALNGILVKFVGTIESVKNKKEQEGGAPA